MAETIGTSIVQRKVGKEEAERWKLGWLNKMLWGGVALLAVEHAWSGEIAPWPPFLTAARSWEEAAIMLKEMAMIGIPMAVVVTVIWVVMVVIARQRERALVEERETESSTTT